MVDIADSVTLNNELLKIMKRLKFCVFNTARASIFLQLYLKLSVLLSFPRSIFWVFSVVTVYFFGSSFSALTLLVG